MSYAPMILIVDDEPDELERLRAAIERRFGVDYRVVARASARAALEEARRYAASGGETALVIADQWMPEMTGVELLQQAGDVRAGSIERVASAVGERAVALEFIREYLVSPGWAQTAPHPEPRPHA